MRRALLLTGILLILSVSVAASTTWQEIDGSGRLAPDPKTHTSLLYFTVILEYDPVPQDFDLETTWVLFEDVGGTEQIVDSYSKPSAAGGQVQRIYVMSSGIPVEAGKVYGAHLTLVDPVNNLRFTRDFGYAVPMIVPIGLRLEGSDGSSGVDLTGVPDAQLEQLASLYRGLQAYSKQETSISLDALLQTSVPDDEAFPSLVVLIPATGLSTTFSDGTQSVTLTVGQALTLYVIPSSAMVRDFREQVAEYDRDFSGDVYQGTGDLGLTDALRVFVGEDTWAVLQEAHAEWARRQAS
jgi:hypothetical protein